MTKGAPEARTRPRRQDDVHRVLRTIIFSEEFQQLAGGVKCTMRSISGDQDETFMREAIAAATERGSDPALSPMGCVIVLDGRVIASARNHVEDHQDATAHAEVEAIRAAGQGRDNGELRRAVLYSTLQPCGMCTMAAIWSKVGRIVYGAGRDDVHRMYFEDRHTDTLAFITDAYRNDLSIQGGVLREECARLCYGPEDAVPIERQGNL